jgi:hypothetical protein
MRCSISVGACLPCAFLLGIAAIADAQSGGGPPGGGVAAIVIDPRTPATVYAIIGPPIGGGLFSGGGGITAIGGVYKSLNGGTSWAPMSLSLPAASPVVVYTLAIDPANSSIVYVGTNVGLFKSANGGQSWNLSGSGLRGVGPIVIDPKNSAVIYLTTADGVFKSIDAGQSWTLINSALTSYCLIVDPSSTTTLYGL